MLAGLIALVAVVLVMTFGASFLIADRMRGVKPPSAVNNSQQRLADKNGKAVYEIQLKKANSKAIDVLLKTGEYVQFNSKDGGEHQIIQGASTNTEHGPTTGPDHGGAVKSESPLDSGVIKPDEGYLLQFNTPGKYEFHDNYDHDYTMTVIVSDPAAKKTIQ